MVVSVRSSGVEHEPFKPMVAGSIPAGRTMKLIVGNVYKIREALLHQFGPEWLCTYDEENHDAGYEQVNQKLILRSWDYKNAIFLTQDGKSVIIDKYWVEQHILEEVK